MNTYGRIFRVHVFGESHGERVGVLLDGVPAGIPLSVDDFRADLQRRKPGASGTTPRKESDEPVLRSGIFQGKTTGAPLLIEFLNENIRSKDYAHLQEHPRPGHADFTARHKYGGFADYRGGGHFSGRLTLALVAAGVVAKKICNPIHIQAQLITAGGNPNIEEAVAKAIHDHDSIGGVVACSAQGLPIGLGEPFFDSLESMISHAIFAIPAIKGIEFGSGFQAAAMRGSEHNDALIAADGTTASNYAGGINGGISNGNELHFRAAVKPTSSIGKTQESFQFAQQSVQPLEVAGRHDVCIALRVPVVVEAVTALVLADALLIAQQRSPIHHEKN